MTRYRLIVLCTSGGTLQSEKRLPLPTCRLIHEAGFLGPDRGLDSAKQAAECMLSVTDYVYGCSTHEVHIHRCTGDGAHETKPVAIVRS